METKDITDIKKINSISSYLAMFPIEVPIDLITKYSNENDLVMDNFSGRGTTAICSRFLKRNFIGNDLNPYSFVLTKIKISKINKENLLEMLNVIEQEYRSWNKIIDWNQFEEMLIYYSKTNLHQILFLRDRLGLNWKTNNEYENAILAFALGLMHGPQRKNGDSIYFSLSMSNFISMSPNYVKQYSEKNNLKKHENNIFEKIKNRINQKFSSILEEDYGDNFYYHNSLEDLSFVKDNSVNLVITSPPYLSLVDYTRSNWIKLWLLGYERSNLKKDIKLKDKLKFEEYIIFIKDYLNNIYKKLKNKAKVCLVVGDVHNLQLIEKVWNKIQDEVKYKKIDLINQDILDNKKSLRAMKKSRQSYKNWKNINIRKGIEHNIIQLKL